MQSAIKVSVAIGVLASVLGGCTTPKGGSIEDRREYVNTEVVETLNAFYEERPQLRQRVESSAGYGVFSSIGTAIIFVNTDGGYGLVHSRINDEDTYMRMAGGGVGLGVGVKDYRILFVFENQEAIDKFIETGWDAGAQADASAQTDDQGGAVSGGGNVYRDIEVFTLTKNGLNIGASLTGTRYWVDEELNGPTGTSSRRNVGDAMDDAADDMEDAAEDAADNIEDAADEID